MLKYCEWKIYLCSANTLKQRNPNEFLDKNYEKTRFKQRLKPTYTHNCKYKTYWGLPTKPNRNQMPHEIAGIAISTTHRKTHMDVYILRSTALLSQVLLVRYNTIEASALCNCIFLAQYPSLYFRFNCHGHRTKAHVSTLTHRFSTQIQLTNILLKRCHRMCKSCKEFHWNLVACKRQEEGENL